jgi:hypothetical protein
MDNKLSNLYVEYDKLEKQYPNIIKINRTILEFHVEKMYKILERCSKATEEITKKEKDFTKKELVTFYRTLPFMSMFE